jgi:hypothetical protein
MTAKQERAACKACKEELEGFRAKVAGKHIEAAKRFDNAASLWFVLGFNHTASACLDLVGECVSKATN